MKFVKRAVLMSVMTLLLISVFSVSAYAWVKESTDNNVGIKISTKEEKTTVNTDTVYRIELTDASGNPVDKASVKLEANMPTASQGGGHAGMDMGTTTEPIVVDAEEVETGVYEAEFTYNMDGQWDLFLGGTTKYGVVNAIFTEDVVAGGPNWVVIGGFIAVVVVTGALFASKNRTRASKIEDGKRITPLNIPVEEE